LNKEQRSSIYVITLPLNNGAKHCFESLPLKSSCTIMCIFIPLYVGWESSHHLSLHVMGFLSIACTPQQISSHSQLSLHVLGHASISIQPPPHDVLGTDSSGFAFQSSSCCHITNSQNRK